MDATGTSFSYSNVLSAISRETQIRGGGNWPIDNIIPQLSEAPYQKRERCFFQTMNQSYSTNNQNIIKIKLDNDNYVDFRQSYLQITVQLDVTGGTYKALANGAWNMFQRITLRGADRKFEYTNYGITMSLLIESALNKDASNFYGRALWGYARSQAERNNDAKAPMVFFLPLYMPPLTQCLIPMGSLREQLTLELELADPQTFVETDGTLPVVTVFDIQLAHDCIETGLDYSNMVNNLINSSGFPIDCREFDNYTNYASGTHSVIEINHRGSGIEAIFSIMRNDNILNQTDVVANNGAAADRIYNWQRFGLQEFSLRWLNRTWPATPYDATNGSKEPWIEYLKAMGKWHVSGLLAETTGIELETFNATRFIVVNDLVQHPGDPAFSNMLNSLTPQRTLYLNWVFDQMPAVPIRVDTWVKHSARYVIRNGRFLRNER